MRAGGNAAAFALRPRLVLRITSDRDDVLRHFRAEYAGTEGGPGGDAAAVEVGFRPVVSPTLRGAHKTVGWRVELGDPDGERLTAGIQLRGRPRGFGLSLVQGYLVEPLLSIAAVRSGCVLLPSAAIGADGGLVLLLGRSRSGKSSLAVRALAAGATVLGDDQVFVAPDGRCAPFPRRMRFYSDLRLTAPRAYRRLPAGVRAGLALRGAARRLTRGFVAPPVRVPISQLGAPARAEPASVDRVVLVERRPDITSVRRHPASTDEAVAFAMTLLAEQRAKLAGAGPAWVDAISRTRAAEAELVRRALQGHQVETVGVPASWSAPEALPVLAHLLGIPS